MRNSLWLALILILLVLAVSGCSQPASQNTTQAMAYAGALDTTYADALDPVNQLALGIQQLAETPDAVTADQAPLLHVLWQTLQGTTLKSDAERYAVLRQIEEKLSEAQLSAIRAMRLTNADAQTWLQAQGYDISLTRDALTASTPEPEVQAEPATATPASLPTLVPTPTATQGTVESDETQNLTTPAPTATPQAVQTAEAQVAPETPAAAVKVPEPAPSAGQGIASPVAAPPALAQIQDTDPGPPFSVEVTTNFAVPDPDLAGGWIYSVGGFVRNESDQTYSLSAVNVTFYDADGFRGAFYPFSSSGGRRVRGGEWIWHGRTTAEYACLILAPGQACPFNVQMTALDMGSFLIHPDAAVVEWHEATSAEVQDVKLIDDNSGYLRISGMVHNNNAYKIKNVMMAGMLRDAAGQTVSFGTVTLLDENIQPGADVHFELRIEKTAYVDYALSVVAEGDFD